MSETHCRHGRKWYRCCDPESNMEIHNREQPAAPGELEMARDEWRRTIRSDFLPVEDRDAIYLQVRALIAAERRDAAREANIGRDFWHQAHGTMKTDRDRLRKELEAIDGKS